MLRTLLAASLLLAIAIPARAVDVNVDRDLDLGSASQIVTTAIPAALPARMDACYSDGRPAKGLTLVHHAINVTNIGNRPIQSLHLKFTFYDSFDEVTTTRSNVADVKLAPGASQKSINLSEWSDGGFPAHISCSIDAIRYADGTIARV